MKIPEDLPQIDLTPVEPEPAEETPKGFWAERTARPGVRLGVRLFLGVVLVGLIVWGYWSWRRDKAAVFERLAQSARASGHVEDAGLFLRNLVDVAPDDGPAHKALAEVYLEQARIQAQGRPVSYASHPQAFYHLQQASRLCPDDLPLQEQLLAAYLARNDGKRGAAVAAVVAARDPEHMLALRTLLVAAIDARRNADVDDLSRRLAARMMTPAAGPIAPRDLLAMADLLLAAVGQAEEEAAALGRAKQALDTYQALAAAQRIGAGDAGTLAAYVMAHVTPKWCPAVVTAATDEATRPWCNIIRQAEALRAPAVAAGQGVPLVYQQSAAAAFARGEPDVGLSIVERGLALPEPAPAARRKDATEQWQSEVLSLHFLAAQYLVARGRGGAARGHINALLSHQSSAGQGHLLAGQVALREGRLETAQRRFGQAQRALGTTPAVRAGLAATLLALRQWQPALEHLAALQADYPRLSPADRDGVAPFFEEGEAGLHFSQLYAELQLGRRPRAAPHWQALRGTPLEARAVAVATADRWKAGEKELALTRLAAARRVFPRDQALLAVELAILRQQGKTAEAQAVVEAFAAAAPDDLRSQLLLCQWRLQHGQTEPAGTALQAIAQRWGETAGVRAAVTVLQAEILLAQGQPKEAVKLLQPLSSDPHVAAAAGWLTAAAQARLDNPQKAAEALEAASQMRPDHALLNLVLGEVAARRSEYDKALERLADALDVTGLRPRAATILGQALRELLPLRAPAELRERLDEWLRRAPDEPRLLVAQAELLMHQGDSAAADRGLAEVGRRHPRDVSLAALIAAARLRAKQPELALQEAQRGLTIEARNGACLLVAAQAALAAGRPQQSLEYATTALEGDPQSVPAALLRAHALERTGRRDESLRTLEEWNRSRPKVPEGYLALGQALAAAGRTNDAVAVYRRGAEKLPDPAAVLAAEIRLLAAGGRLGEATDRADQAAGRDPTPAVCLALGQAFDAGNHFAPAQTWLRRVLTTGDETQRRTAHWLLGAGALRAHRARLTPDVVAEACTHFAAVLEDEPTHLPAANNLAWLLATEQKQPAEAVAILEKARAGGHDGPLPPSVVHTVAVAYRAAGRGEDARTTLERTLAQHPDQARLLLELGTLLVEAKQSDKARPVLERAAKLALSSDDLTRARSLLAQAATAESPERSRPVKQE